MNISKPNSMRSAITPARSWAFVASIMVARFMVDQHPFLLETLARVNNKHISFPTTLQGGM
jgi:hypothetical protein